MRIIDCTSWQYFPIKNNSALGTAIAEYMSKCLLLYSHPTANTTRRMAKLTAHDSGHVGLSCRKGAIIVWTGLSNGIPTTNDTPIIIVAIDNVVGAPTIDQEQRQRLFQNEKRWIQPNNLKLLLNQMDDHPFQFPTTVQIRKASLELDRRERDGRWSIKHINDWMYTRIVKFTVYGWQYWGYYCKDGDTKRFHCNVIRAHRVEKPVLSWIRAHKDILEIHAVMQHATYSLIYLDFSTPYFEPSDLSISPVALCMWQGV